MCLYLAPSNYFRGSKYCGSDTQQSRRSRVTDSPKERLSFCNAIEELVRYYQANLLAQAQHYRSRPYALRATFLLRTRPPMAMVFSQIGGLWPRTKIVKIPGSMWGTPVPL